MHIYIRRYFRRSGFFYDITNRLLPSTTTISPSYLASRYYPQLFSQKYTMQQIFHSHPADKDMHTVHLPQTSQFQNPAQTTPTNYITASFLLIKARQTPQSSGRVVGPWTCPLKLIKLAEGVSLQLLPTIDRSVH